MDNEEQEEKCGGFAAAAAVGGGGFAVEGGGGGGQRGHEDVLPGKDTFLKKTKKCILSFSFEFFRMSLYISGQKPVQ